MHETPEVLNLVTAPCCHAGLHLFE